MSVKIFKADSTPRQKYKVNNLHIADRKNNESHHT